MFSCLWFVKKARKGYFPAILQVFVYFVPPKGLSLKSFFSSYSVFFFGFPFVFPFKTPFYPFAFWPSAPFWRTLIFLFFKSFFFLPFPFLMFACLFQTNFPNIPFLKPKLLSFWLFIYFFCCFCFCSHISCFCLSVLMLALFLVCFICYCLVLVLFLVLLSQTMKKHGFPCNYSVFSHAGYKVVLYFFSFMFLVLFVFFLVLFVSILDI